MKKITKLYCYQNKKGELVGKMFVKEPTSDYRNTYNLKLVELDVNSLKIKE